jgi:hypothetical protein
VWTFPDERTATDQLISTCTVETGRKGVLGNFNRTSRLISKQEKKKKERKQTREEKRKKREKKEKA